VVRNNEVILSVSEIPILTGTWEHIETEDHSMQQKHIWQLADLHRRKAHLNRRPIVSRLFRLKREDKHHSKEKHKNEMEFQLLMRDSICHLPYINGAVNANQVLIKNTRDREGAY